MSNSAATSELHDHLVAWRRDFHRHAEPGWEEFRTASRIVTELRRLGWDVAFGPAVIDEATRMGVPTTGALAAARERAISQDADPALVAAMGEGFTGVVGTWATGRPGTHMGFRFDIDSNDLVESTADHHRPTSAGFASINEGAMHGCGHDGHAAIGLGLAEVIAADPDSVDGTITLVFQPAEEGVRGAQAMVSAGVLDDIDVFVATHLGVMAEFGEVVCGAQNFFATTKFDVEFTGLAAHAAADPEAGRNALLAAANAALNLHALTRHSGGDSRVNVGTLVAGQGRNVIAPTGHLRVETRGRTSAVNDYLYTRAEAVVAGAATMYDVDFAITKTGQAQGADPSPRLVKYMQERIAGIDGVTEVIDYRDCGGSDDANTMISHVTDRGGIGAYMVIGTTLPSGHHTATFDIDEASLDIGLAALVSIARGAQQLPTRTESR